MIRGFYALAVSLVAALLVTLASAPLPVPRPVETSRQPAERELTFEERWAPVRQLPPMIHINELPPRVIPVRTIAIRAEPAVYIEEEERGIHEGAGNSGARPTGAARAKYESVGRTVPSWMPRSKDICARHNMRKQIARGGKSWRCRR